MDNYVFSQPPLAEVFFFLFFSPALVLGHRDQSLRRTEPTVCGVGAI